jgi:ABC-type polysaccharide/polyol phosphate export permease
MNILKKYIRKIEDALRLSFTLAKTNFKLRNEGSYLGILWYLLEPLCFFGIILLIGGVINQDSVPYYPLYLFLGLIMFNFFISTTTNALKSITYNAGLIKSMKIDYQSLVMSGVFQFVFSHVLEMVIFLGFMVYFGANFLNLIFYLPIFFFFLLFVLGLSFVLATLEIYISDLSNVWSVLVRLLWFLTPIFYVMPPNSLFQKISYINPLFHFINVSREIIIYGRNPGLHVLFLMVFFSILSLLFGLFIFQRYKSKFPEMV